MSKRERLQHYYDLMIKKFSATDLTPNQAQVYKEIKELVAPYETGAEVAQVLKDSGYQEKPAQALYLDMLESHARAYADLDMHDVAEVYRSKYKEVESDYAQAHITGWEQEVNKRLARWHNLAHYINNIFTTLFLFESTYPAHPDRETLLSTIKSNLDSINNEGENLRDLCSQPYFAKHLPYSQDQIMERVSRVEEIANQPAIDPEVDADYKRRYAEAIEWVKENKDQLKEKHDSYNARCTRTAFLSIAKEKHEGEYITEEFYSAPAQ